LSGWTLALPELFFVPFSNWFLAQCKTVLLSLQRAFADHSFGAAAHVSVAYSDSAVNVFMIANLLFSAAAFIPVLLIADWASIAALSYAHEVLCCKIRLCAILDVNPDNPPPTVPLKAQVLDSHHSLSSMARSSITATSIGSSSPSGHSDAFSVIRALAIRASSVHHVAQEFDATL
jgi:hypothetical protein